MIPRDLIGDLIATLEQLRQIVPSDRATWDGDLVMRLAVERLWITRGVPDPHVRKYVSRTLDATRRTGRINVN